jgi:hypothetical protein
MTVRQKIVDERLREFLDAVAFVEERPLLLWSPQVDEAARLLVAAVAEMRSEKKRAS